MSEQKMEQMRQMAEMLCKVAEKDEATVELVAAGMQTGYALGAQSARTAQGKD